MGYSHMTITHAGFDKGQWVLFVVSPMGTQWVVPTKEALCEALLRERGGGVHPISDLNINEGDAE